MRGGFFFYLKAQLKRASRLAPGVLAVVLILLVCVGLLGSIMLSRSQNNESRFKINIGIVGDTSDPYIQLALFAVKNLDPSRFSMELLELTEDEAQQMMKAGKINAYVLVPDGYIDSISYGENIPATYVSTEGAVGIGVMILDELVESLSSLLLESQNAVYGMQRYVDEHGIDIDKWDAAEVMSFDYLDKVFSREELFTVETVSVHGQLSLPAYFVCGISVFFLMLWGISACSLFAGNDLSLARLMKSRGKGAAFQAGAEFISFFVLMLLSLVCIGALIAAGTSSLGIGLAEWGGDRVRGAVIHVLRLVPAALMFSAMQFFVYELLGGRINAVLVQFLIAVGMGYVCGCLYPVSFMPDVLQNAASFLPAGAAMDFMTKGLLDESAAVSGLVMTAYAVLFWLASVLVRRRRIA